MVADRKCHLIVGLVYLALLLQHFLLKVGLCWVRHQAVRLETFMPTNSVPPLGSTRTLWRPSITINSMPVLWQSVRWPLQQLAAGSVRYWGLRILQLAELRQKFLLELDSLLSFRLASLLETTMASKCVPQQFPGHRRALLLKTGATCGGLQGGVGSAHGRSTAPHHQDPY